MDVVVQIQGRDALPVRAVPFAGRWQWMSSPDGIASACSQKPIKTVRFETELNGGEKEVAVRNREYLPSFFLQGNGTVRPLHPDEWSFCAVELKGLEAKLRGEEKVEDENFASWRRQAIEALPAGVFVWLDDFKRWISDTCQPDCVDQEQDDDVIEEPTLQPFVPPELEGVLFEGLRSNWPRNRLNDEQSFVPLSSALADWFETPFNDLPGEQWYRVKTDFWPMPWDELSPNQRREVAAQWDCSHDPEAADEQKRLWDLFCRQDALQREIREWEVLNPQSITEKAEQTDRLLALREQERLLRVQLASDPAGSTQEDRAQQQGEAEAIAQEPAQAVGVDVAQVQSQGEQGGMSDTTGLVAWQAAAIELWPKIAAVYGRYPTTRHVMVWLKRDGPRDVFPAEQPDRNSLRWIDRDGNTQTVAYKSIASRISEWKKAGKIPA